MAFPTLQFLSVFNEYLYSASTEIIDQQIDKFNEASAGALVLRNTATQGDYSDLSFYQRIAGGLVRRRNAYAATAITHKNLKSIVDTMVKVGGGTFTLDLSPSDFEWIQRSQEEAGAVIGKQLAADMMADMLNTAIGATSNALFSNSASVFDVMLGGIGGVDVDTTSWRNLNKTAFLMGDASQNIVCWVMHSGAAQHLFDGNLANANNLFNFGSVNVLRDPFGRLIVISDSPELLSLDGSGTPMHRVLGLTQAAAIVGKNDDFVANDQRTNGMENIQMSYQAEWSYTLGIKGFSWNKQTGGHSPTDASLFSISNWNKTATSNKDLAGVMLIAKAA